MLQPCWISLIIPGSTNKNGASFKSLFSSILAVKFIKYHLFYLIIMESETLLVKREAIVDLVRVKEEFDFIIESLELMSDSEFMSSYAKSKWQVEKREFVDWNDL